MYQDTALHLLMPLHQLIFEVVEDPKALLRVSSHGSSYYGVKGEVKLGWFEHITLSNPCSDVLLL